MGWTFSKRRLRLELIEGVERVREGDGCMIYAIQNPETPQFASIKFKQSDPRGLRGFRISKKEASP